MGLKRLLHAGCGSRLNTPPREFAAFKETRLDCNPMVGPEILASIVAMPMVRDDSFDAVFCSHTLEHLFAHEVAMALAEFRRVLLPGGELVVSTPDLQSIGGKLALDQADYVLYQSAIGPITALDVLYGHRGSIVAGNAFMGHKTGFTSSVMKAALAAAGFTKIEVERDPNPNAAFQLNARARKSEASAAAALDETCLVGMA